MVKKLITLILILVMTLSLTSCGKVPEEGKEANAKDKLENKANLKDKLEKKEESETIIVKDENGLVEVHIKDGQAASYYDLEKWEKVFKISNYEFTSPPFPGPYPFTYLSSKVKDAYIAVVEEMDYLNGLDGIVPIIFLLMEDGTVEWAVAEPFWDSTEEDAELASSGTIPWIRDIEALSYENNNEGIGEKTLYGIDSKGDKYNLELAARFSELPIGQWIWTLEDEIGAEDDIGVLRFTEDGKASFEIGTLEGPDYTVYKGSYSLLLQEAGHIRSGNLSLDLKLESSTKSDKVVESIKGSFFAQDFNLINIVLWPGGGDNLNIYRDKKDMDIESFSFWLGNDPLEGKFKQNPFMDENIIEDYSQYLIDNLPKARDLVEKHGMAILDTENYIEFPEGTGKELCLGTNHQGKFTKEIFYYITDSGTIYEYDTLIGDYKMVRP